MKGLNVEDELASPDSILYPEFANGVKFKDPSFGPDIDFSANPLVLPQTDLHVESSPSRIEGDSLTDDKVFSETLLNYINQMLEEKMEQKPCMFHDPLALQAAEKSLCDVLGEDNPLPSPNHTLSYGDQFLVDSLDDGMLSTFSDYSTQSSSSLNTSGSLDHPWGSESGDPKSSFMQMPLPTNFVYQSTAKPTLRPGNSGMASSFAGNFTVPNPFRESDLALQFMRGVEEANKFLPKGNQLNINLDTSRLTSGSKVKAPKVEVKIEKEETEYFPSWLNTRKNREREDEEVEEERSNKQLAVYDDETELAEMFDKVLVDTTERRLSHCPPCSQNEPLEGEKSQKNRQPFGSNAAKPRITRHVYRLESVDLRTILILCAQAVSSDDRLTANELLKQIRQHSSLLGDGSQRLAHCFANGLEARLAGTGTQIYSALCTTKTSAADMLKTIGGYLSACPFNKVAIIFANQNILKVAEKATTLHIIDFGIRYGFQWPDIIYRLSKREGGPPKLRITGIELPQSGFRPSERVQDIGRWLAKYCELHNVPFEYNGIAQKWETVQTADLGIRPGETVAVNSLFRLKNLLDETVAISSPRDTVLNLIRKTKPDIFVHAINNGSFSTPFFVSRFREALFHYSCLFDMLDCNTQLEDPMRLKFEKEFFGREVMNVLACEGSERVERPETYKQWEVRSTRAGLKKLPLDPQLMKRTKSMMAIKYHEDFVIDEDSDWMLQGWKGRIICASSAWIAKPFSV